jgi:di/tricarboxylate transporter
MKLFIKGILVYTTFITVVILICALDSIVFSNWFIPIIGIIVTGFILINKYVYWDELKRILFIN